MYTRKKMTSKALSKKWAFPLTARFEFWGSSLWRRIKIGTLHLPSKQQRIMPESTKKKEVKRYGPMCSPAIRETYLQQIWAPDTWQTMPVSWDLFYPPDMLFLSQWGSPDNNKYLTLCPKTSLKIRPRVTNLILGARVRSAVSLALCSLFHLGRGSEPCL